ncbi:helix-turn-helix domain-containing protein [Bacteroides fragilis]
MLVVARQLRQMTQDDVCLKADISQGILSKAENGLRELQDDVLNRLSRVYDLPISFFIEKTTCHLYPICILEENYLFLQKRLILLSLNQELSSLH